MRDSNIINKVEAVLFASGKPMSGDIIMSIIEEESKKRLNSALKTLKKTYDDSGSSLMIIEQDGLWKLTVREQYLPIVRKIVSDTELSKTVLETLAVIAWKSPLLQSEVIKVRTNKAYEHIDQLEKLGFITKKKEGRSFILSLSEKFFEYFDVEKGDIKKMFKDSKGIEKELEIEQKKHIQNDSVEPNEESKDIREAVDAEGPHLGKLEVVDSIDNEQPESIEIVDVIEESNDEKEEDISDEMKDVEEIIEDLDEEK